MDIKVRKQMEKSCSCWEKKTDFKEIIFIKVAQKWKGFCLDKDNLAL